MTESSWEQRRNNFQCRQYGGREIQLMARHQWRLNISELRVGLETFRYNSELEVGRYGI